MGFSTEHNDTHTLKPNKGNKLTSKAASALGANMDSLETAVILRTLLAIVDSDSCCDPT